MLFMAIFSYSPEDRNQVIERRMGEAGKDMAVEIIPVMETEKAIKVLKRFYKG